MVFYDVLETDVVIIESQAKIEAKDSVRDAS